MSQPAHGRVALANRTATYRPEPGFAGQDAFTFAVWGCTGNDVVTQWPATPADFLLESAPDLPGVAWMPVSQVPQVIDGQSTVPVRATGAGQYFRLRKAP